VHAAAAADDLVLGLHLGDAVVDEASWKQAWEIAKEMNVAPPTVKSLQEGCATGLATALDPALNGESLFFLEMPFGNSIDAGERAGKSRAYLIDCNFKPAVEHATSPELAEKLWTLSEELLGEEFVI
jgi:hypothetical protein